MLPIYKLVNTTSIVVPNKEVVTQTYGQELFYKY